MSLLLLFGRQGAVTSGSGEAALDLALVGQGAATHYGSGTAALTLGLEGTGERPAAPGEHLGWGEAHLTLGLIGVGDAPPDPGLQTTVRYWTAVSDWVDITEDVLALDGLRITRGLSSNRPTDCLASSGELSFSLRNDAENTAGLLGYYSPLHVNVRPGWGFGAYIQVIWNFEPAVRVAILIRAGDTVFAQTVGPHGFGNGDWVVITGASPPDYMLSPVGWDPYIQITATSTDTFQYPGVGGPQPPATGIVSVARVFIKFSGRVDTIDPIPGEYGSLAVRVTAYDTMRDILDAEVRDVALQVNQTDDVITGVLLDTLDAEVQPAFRSIDPGLDLMQYALHDIGAGVQLGSILGDLCRSTYSLGFTTGDDTYRQINRNTRATAGAVSGWTFTDTMHGLAAPSSLGNVYNSVRTIVHPMTVGAIIVLAELTGEPPVVPAGATVPFEGQFRDPDNKLRLIGGSDIQQTLYAPGLYRISPPDYAATSGGVDVTAYIFVAVSTYATRVVWTVVNTYTAPATITTLQLRGRGVYDNGPTAFTASSVQSYGVRPITIDLPYQADATIGQQIGEFVRDQYESLSDQIDSIAIVANYSTHYMREGLYRDIGHVITIAEVVTGLALVKAMILSCEYSLQPGDELIVRWGLGPTITIDRPDTPSGLTVTTVHDTALTVSWTTETPGASTQLFLGGLHIQTLGIGVTATTIYDLTPATNYSFQVRHLYFGLTSDLSAAVIGRPSVVGTGGNSTFDSGGLRYHYFTSSGSFTMTVPGRITITGVGGGGGGGAYQDNTGTGGGPTGGGGGGGGRVEFLVNEEEPAGVHAIVIGAGGIGAATLGQNGQIGGSTTYRVDHMICEGGGRGAGGSGAPNAGGTGGSGGGGAGTGGGSGGNNVGGAGLGFNGGNGGVNPGGAVGGGGGGGAGGAGGNATTIGGAGGAAYAGLAAGGVGGRGTSPAAGTANTGTGGGGGQESHPTGYAGGSGILYITYPI